MPEAVLVNVLNYVDLKHRGHCALVCRSWAKAAAAATDSITVWSLTKARSLQLWLRKHGGGVRSISLSVTSQPVGALTKLPCPKLQDLQLLGEAC